MVHFLGSTLMVCVFYSDGAFFTINSDNACIRRTYKTSHNILSHTTKHPTTKGPTTKHPTLQNIPQQNVPQQNIPHYKTSQTTNHPSLSK